jgi:hypothetical protein
MSIRSVLIAFAFGLGASSVHGQPADSPEQAKRTVATYAFLMDASGNRVLVSTAFWRNDAKYDDRAFHRFLDVMSGVEKRGFRQDEKAQISNWDAPAPYARCYIYLEDLQSGQRTKAGVTSGARVWCSSSGISEQDVKHSDAPKHVDQVLQRFDSMLSLARKNLKK